MTKPKSAEEWAEELGVQLHSAHLNERTLKVIKSIQLDAMRAGTRKAAASNVETLMFKRTISMTFEKSDEIKAWISATISEMQKAILTAADNLKLSDL